MSYLMLGLVWIVGCGGSSGDDVKVTKRVQDIPMRRSPATQGGAELPGGELVVTDCYGGSFDEGLVANNTRRRGAPPAQRRTGSTSWGRGAPGQAAKGRGAKGKRGKAAPAPAPKPSPTLKIIMGDGSGKGVQRPSAGDMEEAARAPSGRSYQSAKTEEAQSFDRGGRKRANRQEGGAPRTEPAESVRIELDQKKQKEMANKPADDPSPITLIPDAEPEPDFTPRGPRHRRIRKPQRRWDWGGKTYLSNDDSMSLASAQRVLFAAQQGLPVKPSQIRPHELLNYFTFQTAPVPQDRMFSVLGVADQQDDTLSVAFSVQGATPARQPLDLTVLIDRSGSMSAEGRMDYTKRGLRKLASNLQRGDRIDVVLFDSQVCTPLHNYVVGRDDPALLTRTINGMQPRGSTNLDAGLRQAYRLQMTRSAAEVHHRNRRVLLLTDAMLNRGNVDEDLVSEVGRMFDKQNIRLTGIGVGREFNDGMLDRLTEKGKGAYVYLGSEAVVDRVFGAGFASLTQTIAHDVQFELKLPPTLALEKFYGEESSTNAADIQPIHYYAGTSQVFLQDLHVHKDGAKSDDVITLTIRYREADTGEPAEHVFETTVGALLDSDKRNLHKARALVSFADLLTARAMGSREQACGEPLATYRKHADNTGGDAEIQFVSGLTAKVCGVPLAAGATTIPEAGEAPFTVKLDSDHPIDRIELQCAGSTVTRTMTAGSNVARLQGPPGDCTLKLQGTLVHRIPVRLSGAAKTVRCVVRGVNAQCS